MEMTAGAAWPAADEDTYRRRSEELTDTHTQVSGAREQWESHRHAVFGGDAVWSGRAADAAVAEIDSRTTAMGTLQRQLRTAADQAGAAASAITDAKSQVADNVRMAQQVIAQAETLDADGIDAFINQVVVSTYAANTEVVATAAARLTGPGTEKNELPDKPLKAFGPAGPPQKVPDTFGPTKDSPARDPDPPAVPDQGLTVVPDDQVIRGNLDFDPTNSRIGDERYGHWENVPPFMGPRNGPPPPRPQPRRQPRPRARPRPGGSPWTPGRGRAGW
jgi:hypothetical protein